MACQLSTRLTRRCTAKSRMNEAHSKRQNLPPTCQSYSGPFVATKHRRRSVQFRSSYCTLSRGDVLNAWRNGGSGSTSSSSAGHGQLIGKFASSRILPCCFQWAIITIVKPSRALWRLLTAVDIECTGFIDYCTRGGVSSLPKLYVTAEQWAPGR